MQESVGMKVLWRNRPAGRLESSAISAMQMCSRLLLVLVLAAGLLGCGLFESEDTVTVDGTFEGRADIRGDSWELRLALSEASSHEVTGAGSLSRVDSDIAIPLTIDGVHEHPDLTLSLSSSGFLDKDFTGTVTGDGHGIEGTMRDPEIEVPFTLDERD